MKQQSMLGNIKEDKNIFLNQHASTKYSLHNHSVECHDHGQHDNV